MAGSKAKRKVSLEGRTIMKFRSKVVVSKRVSHNRRIKGFEQIGLTVKYLEPITDTYDGRYFIIEDEQEDTKNHENHEDSAVFR